MANYARAEIVEEGEVGIYHCLVGCVRGALLFGDDPSTGRKYNHRKEWIIDRLRVLAGLFAVDVTAFAVMSDRLHVMARIRPDLAESWTDEEVARRWWPVFPGRHLVDGQLPPPEPAQLKALMADAKSHATRRERLASLSWFMRSLTEPIARRANREDGCRGRFWETRFKSIAILDDGAALTCAAFVDSIPIQAGLAKSPETSKNTSAFERIQARRARLGAKGTRSATGQDADRDAWLCPIEMSEPLEAVKSPGAAKSRTKAQGGAGKSTSRGPKKAPAARASGQGFLPISEETYFELLTWSARALRDGKLGTIPSDLAGVFEQLELSAETWLDSIRNFTHLYPRAAGSPAAMLARAKKSGMRWFHGVRHSRSSFGSCADGRERELSH